ncbi:hypothetical protein RHGRI_009293 [Rhododendron griersonianum]|uniref:GH16 domain-containing protein n=1 Tax=Rhododendron griersonianum TaxID=479676 RepID=A0AAV6L556_9ERIC|nr:hypothetical protein RHGRI_009293 [Rhododendron griersonianum]
MVSTKMFLAVMIALSFLDAAFAGNFLEDFSIGYGDWRTKILENGQMLYLSLDCALRRMITKGMIHHEIDFEFLGDVSGKLYTLQTNIYVYGAGKNEQSFYVDEIPIRQFKNFESRGIPYPKDQQMQIQCSLWEASDWATRGGRIKIDWSLAPFTASYQNFNVLACT